MENDAVKGLCINHIFIAVKPKLCLFILKKKKGHEVALRLSLAMGCVHGVGASRCFPLGYWSCWGLPPRP